MTMVKSVISKILIVWFVLAIPFVACNQVKHALPPSRLQSPLTNYTFRQINDGGPPDPYPAAKSSLNLEQIDMYEPATIDLFQDIQSGLRYVLETNNEWTFAIHGTGTTGMNAALDNMIERGDKVLVLNNGHWGEVMSIMSTRLGAESVQLKKPAGSTYSLLEVQLAMMRHRPKILAVVQGESSTGVHQSLDGFGALCHRYGAYLVVDFISVMGIRSIQMDAWMVDVAIGSSHKGVGGVAGLAVVSLSDRAVSMIKARKTLPTGYQTDLALQKELWQPVHSYGQSLSFSVLYALREALRTIAQEGRENVYKRHADTTEKLGSQLTAMGFRHFVARPSDRMIGFTFVVPPWGKDIAKINKFIKDRHAIFLSDGVGPTKGKIIRLTTYAMNADMDRINKILTAVRAALDSPETNST